MTLNSFDYWLDRVKNKIDEKKLSDEAESFISAKIKKLIEEGKPRKQAVAIAYSYAKKKGFKNIEESKDADGFFKYSQKKIDKFVSQFSDTVRSQELVDLYYDALEIYNLNHPEDKIIDDSRTNFKGLLSNVLSKMNSQDKHEFYNNWTEWFEPSMRESKSMFKPFEFYLREQRMNENIAIELDSLIEEYILDRINTENFDENPTTPAEKIKFLIDRYYDEAASDYNLNRYKTHMKCFEEWIRGIPSCFDIDFNYSDLINIAHAWELIPMDATDDDIDTFNENWYAFITANVEKIANKYGMSINNK